MSTVTLTSKLIKPYCFWFQTKNPVYISGHVQIQRRSSPLLKLRWKGKRMVFQRRNLFQSSEQCANYSKLLYQLPVNLAEHLCLMNKNRPEVHHFPQDCMCAQQKLRISAKFDQCLFRQAMIQSVSRRTANTLIEQQGYVSWTESSLDAHAIL